MTIVTQIVYVKHIFMKYIEIHSMSFDEKDYAEIHVLILKNATWIILCRTDFEVSMYDDNIIK